MRYEVLAPAGQNLGFPDVVKEQITWAVSPSPPTRKEYIALSCFDGSGRLLMDRAIAWNGKFGTKWYKELEPKPLERWPGYGRIVATKPRSIVTFSFRMASCMWRVGGNLWRRAIHEDELALAGTEEVHGKLCYVLKGRVLTSLKEFKVPRGGVGVRAWVDPVAGFMARKIEAECVSTPELDVSCSFEVFEFRRLEPGVWLPWHVRDLAGVEYKVISARVGENAVTDEVFEIRWPNGTLVWDAVCSMEYTVGKEGRELASTGRAKSITEDDLNAIVRSAREQARGIQSSDAESSKRRKWRVSWIALAIVVVLGFGLRVARRMHGKRH